MSAPAGVKSSDDGDESPSSSTSSPTEQQSVALSPLSSIPADFRAALDAFRNDWQREVKAAANAATTTTTTDNSTIDTSKSAISAGDKEKELLAAELFRSAVELEQCGKVYDALPLYRRAVHLVPDIEFKYYEQHKLKNSTRHAPASKIEIESNIINNNNNAADASAIIVGSLEEKFTQDLANDYNGRLILSNRDAGVISTSLHISDLPPEILHYILRWVVSSHLDVRSLENCAAVCKGMYLCARDDELWRLACVKIWGADVGSVDANDKSGIYKSWRRMFIERDRVLYHGCYISKTTYLRMGENSFQDQYYRPVQLVEYYRYLRFLPDGTVLMMTTADEPLVGVNKLRVTYPTRTDVKRGQYFLTGNELTVLMHKQQQQQSQRSHARQRQRGNALSDENTSSTKYRMEFRISNSVKRPFGKLVWLNYSIVIYHNTVENSSSFDVSPSKYPPLWFSPVRSYHTDAEAPLA